MLLFVIFFYLMMLQIHRRRIAHQQEMHELTIQYERTLLQSQLEIQEQTFRNISQEIHDNVGQVLSLAKLNLNSVGNAAPSAEKINVTEQLLGKALSDLRDISKSLSGEKISEIGLQNAIQNELRMIERITSMKCFFKYDSFTAQFSKEVNTIIFRMVQEILNNIIKHAKATQINVTLTSNEHQSSIHINDDGTGFDPSSLEEVNTGIGLGNIKKRCDLIQGVCTITSKPGEGTSVNIAVRHDQKISA
jgi:signal transduction histidine kinase